MEFFFGRLNVSYGRSDAILLDICSFLAAYLSFKHESFLLSHYLFRCWSVRRQWHVLTHKPGSQYYNIILFISISNQLYLSPEGSSISIWASHPVCAGCRVKLSFCSSIFIPYTLSVFCWCCAGSCSGFVFSFFFKWLLQRQKGLMRIVTVNWNNQVVGCKTETVSWKPRQLMTDRLKSCIEMKWTKELCDNSLQLTRILKSAMILRRQ